ncbi:MAG: O-antigen ligase family protein [Nibricoccus sp.]
MPPKLALLFGVIFILVAFRFEKKRDFGLTSGLFWPTLWYMVVASRPIGVWLITWGVPLPGGVANPEDGSIIDRLFFAILAVIGLRILSKRGFSWTRAIADNKCLTFFVLYIAISICWSDYTFVSFKRFIKLFGSIVMAMVVLTNGRPLDSIFTVLRRCLYIHIPMSIICTRYFREIGVSFEWNGTVEFWQGIATSKNTLGQITMLAVLYFTWDIYKNWKQIGLKNFHVIYLMMSVFLLKGSSGAISMTSLFVSIFALFIFFTIQFLRKQQGLVRVFVAGVFTALFLLVVVVVIHSLDPFAEKSFFGKIITTVGRDITLTDRTYIWSDVYKAAADSPLVGVGFGAFWIGREANIPWNETMTWVLGQAHSGYVDTYLQLGIVGWFLLFIILVFSLAKMLSKLAEDFDYACLRITLLLTVMFVDITESIYLRGDHHLWLVFQLALWSVPPTYLMAESAADYAVEEPFLTDEEKASAT